MVLAAGGVARAEDDLYYEDRHESEDTWAHQAADIGYWSFLPALALGINADAFRDTNLTASLAVEGVAVGGCAVLVPVVAAGASAARRVDGVTIAGCRLCRLVGWISYGAMLVEAGVAFALSAFMPVPPALFSTSALLGSLSLLVMATDANQSWRARHRSGPLRASRRGEGTVAVAPWVAPFSDGETVTGGLVGIGVVR
jgi:hypothetical protein